MNLLDELNLDPALAGKPETIVRLNTWARRVRAFLYALAAREIKTVRLTVNTDLPLTIKTRFSRVTSVVVLSAVRADDAGLARVSSPVVTWKTENGQPRVQDIGSLTTTVPYDVTFEMRGT